jgi:thiol:disulfide interchange protein DsbC
LAAATLAFAWAPATAQSGVQMPVPEAAIKRNLKERMPSLGSIDEINRTALPGIYEVRVDTDIFYSDGDGNFLFVGDLIDTRKKRNLTEERKEKLLAISFDDLPLKDAFTIVRGDGKRKVAVFEDPNCGYCKRFERDMQKVDNVTIYMFLYPILGPDSATKTRQIWCTKDRGKTWQDWMVRDVVPRSDQNCDLSAIQRNLDFGKKNKITGTPTLLFADGSRVPGAIPASEVEKMLAK